MIALFRRPVVSYQLAILHHINLLIPNVSVVDTYASSFDILSEQSFDNTIYIMVS